MNSPIRLSPERAGNTEWDSQDSENRTGENFLAGQFHTHQLPILPAPGPANNFHKGSFQKLPARQVSSWPVGKIIAFPTTCRYNLLRPVKRRLFLPLGDN
jgi:hypothetical protein